MQTLLFWGFTRNSGEATAWKCISIKLPLLVNGPLFKNTDQNYSCFGVVKLQKILNILKIVKTWSRFGFTLLKINHILYPYYIVNQCSYQEFIITLLKLCGHQKIIFKNHIFPLFKMGQQWCHLLCMENKIYVSQCSLVISPLWFEYAK